MKKKLLITAITLAIIILINGCINKDTSKNLKKEVVKTTNNPSHNLTKATEKKVTDKTKELYDSLNLEGKLTYKIFKIAMLGLESINPPKKEYIAIVDFTKDSSEKRFFMIDLVNKKVLYNDLVAHGRNSGEKVTKKFSNTEDSHMSSLGFYVTNETYYGSNGYSLRLEGLDPGLNDNARKRAIVLHGAPYVSTENIEETGKIGRSWGCPAVPMAIYRDVIDKLKGGNLLFHYAKDYEKKTTLLKEINPN